MNDQRYTRTAMWLHWLIALLLICQFIFGWYLNGIPKGIPDRSYFVNLHKSTGMLIGLLIVVRIGWRLTHTPPALPDSMPRWQRHAANINHVLLYVVMIAMPLSGYTASNFSKWGVKFFNTISLPPWGYEDKQVYAFFNQMHDVLGWVLLTLVTLHVLAALWHLLVGHNTVFSRMSRGPSSGR